MKEWKRHAAIVLAAGKGSRMKCDVPKQYLSLKGKPVLYYALKAFEESFIDEIVLVTGVGQEEYCQKEIVEHYGFQKVSHVIAGGKSAMTRCIGESAHWNVLIMFIFMMARGRLSIMHFCAAPGIP